MTGRVQVFSDPQIIKTLQENFVTVATDDWYSRRQKDAVGEFFRKMSAGGPQRPEGATRQGLYCFTADGVLLGFRNPVQAEPVRELLRSSLAKWQALPAAQREPRAFDAERGKPDAAYHRPLPEGGVAVRVYARELEADGQGGYRKAPARPGAPGFASLDHLWLRREEWQALLPTKPEVGATYTVPAPIVRRIARFHLIDNTRGEPPMWEAGELRSSDLRLTVERVEKSVVTLRLAGKVHLETRAGDRGYQPTLDGTLAYDTEANAFRRFDVVALGDHWGEGSYTRGARPGRTPLGIAFQLADGKQEADKIPPQAARELGLYFGRD